MSAQPITLPEQAPLVGRWGILGGTFDPIHYGHLAIAEAAREDLALQGVLFVPAGTPPHKPAPIASARDRLAMVERAVTDNRFFLVSREESERAGTSYAVDTLERLSETSPRAEFVYVMSAEAAASLGQWRHPERILTLARIAITPRLGHPPQDREWLTTHFAGLEDRFSLLSRPRLGHAASEIRALLAEGRSIRYLVPPAVEAYISERALYRARQA